METQNPIVQRGKEHMYDNIFVSKSRKKELSDTYIYPYLCKHKNTTICLFLPDKNVRRWSSMLRLMFGRIEFMRELLDNDKPLSIWVWVTPWKKEVPQKDRFTENDINSGSTTLHLSGPLSSRNGEICLWRTEEILKVLVHEIIHAFRIDERDPAPKEAFVELRAVYANIYLELLERQIPLTNYPRVLKNEQLFGRRQCRKIREYHPGKTNIHAYLGERNRLLNNISKEKWERLMKTIKPSPGRELRFTNAERLLRKEAARRDGSGNALTIPSFS